MYRLFLENRHLQLSRDFQYLTLTYLGIKIVVKQKVNKRRVF